MCSSSIGLWLAVDAVITEIRGISVFESPILRDLICELSIRSSMVQLTTFCSSLHALHSLVIKPGPSV